MHLTVQASQSEVLVHAGQVFSSAVAAAGSVFCGCRDDHLYKIVI